MNRAISWICVVKSRIQVNRWLKKTEATGSEGPAKRSAAKSRARCSANTRGGGEGTEPTERLYKSVDSIYLLEHGFFQAQIQ